MTGEMRQRRSGLLKSRGGMFDDVSICRTNVAPYRFDLM